MGAIWLADFTLYENLTEEQWGELARIFTDKYMERVEHACQVYISEASEKPPGYVADGKRLVDIGKKASELYELLEYKNSESALERLEDHIMLIDHNFKTSEFIEDLKKRLDYLARMTSFNSTAERTRNSKREMSKGSVEAAERTLVFLLWSAYRQAHGKPAGRRNDSYKEDYERGSLVETTEILRPILGLKNNLADHISKVSRKYNAEKRSKRMDNK
jgi:hypothetical protein